MVRSTILGVRGRHTYESLLNRSVGHTMNAEEQTAAPDSKKQPDVVSTVAASQGRVASVDALRGFDMFWIIGGHAIVFAFAGLFWEPIPAWLEYQMRHPPWIGFSAWDMIMPLFLFIVGVAMPFSFGKRIAQGHSKFHIYRKVVLRTAILFFLGMIAQGNLLEFKLDTLHVYCNTLQAIAVGYLFASIILLQLPIVLQVTVTAGLLAGFWALMTYVPFPGGEAGTLEPFNNLALYIDKTILGRFDDGNSYTWILSGMGFTATVMLGVFGGQILRGKWSAWTKAAVLTLLGIVCLGAGWAWGFWLPEVTADSTDFAKQLAFPVIKHLWTSSMVLWAGGWSYLLLAAFYVLIDILGWRRWAFPFIVIGANAIAVYMATHVIRFRGITDPILDGLMAQLRRTEQLASAEELIRSLAAFMLIWLLLWYMYRKKTFIRI
jgi:predicted acyltransferase